MWGAQPSAELRRAVTTDDLDKDLLLRIYGQNVVPPGNKASKRSASGKQQQQQEPAKKKRKD